AWSRLGGLPRQGPRRRDLFSVLGMRNAEAHRFGHSGVGKQDLVDLTRRNLFTAAVDQFFQATNQGEIAIDIEDALVAGTKPAVGKGGGIGLRVIVIAAGDVWPLDDNLALRASREQSTCVVHEGDLHTGSPAN